MALKKVKICLVQHNVLGMQLSWLERLTGSQEVVGSSPIFSTVIIKHLQYICRCFYLYSTRNALLVQRIEQEFPKLQIQVRFLGRVHFLFDVLDAIKDPNHPIHKNLNSDLVIELYINVFSSLKQVQLNQDLKALVIRVWLKG